MKEILSCSRLYRVNSPADVGTLLESYDREKTLANINANDLQADLGRNKLKLRLSRTVPDPVLIRRVTSKFKDKHVRLSPISPKPSDLHWSTTFSKSFKTLSRSSLKVISSKRRVVQTGSPSYTHRAEYVS